jgi:hypothetical protein
VKSSIKTSILATLGIATFAGVSLLSIKVNQPTASNHETRTTIANKATAAVNLQFTPNSINFSSNNSYLSPNFGNNKYSTLFPNHPQFNPFEVSFGGEVAEAAVGKVIGECLRFGKRYWTEIVTIGGAAIQIVEPMTRSNEIFAFPDNQPIEWKEASDFCNRKYGNLIWKNGLKTCIKR